MPPPLPVHSLPLSTGSWTPRCQEIADVIGQVLTTKIVDPFLRKLQLKKIVVNKISFFLNHSNDMLAATTIRLRSGSNPKIHLFLEKTGDILNTYFSHCITFCVLDPTAG